MHVPEPGLLGQEHDLAAVRTVTRLHHARCVRAAVVQEAVDDVGLGFDASTMASYGSVLDANYSSAAAGDLTLDAFDNTGGTTGVTVTDAGVAYTFTLDGGGVWNGGVVGGVLGVGTDTLTVTKATFTARKMFSVSFTASAVFASDTTTVLITKAS